MKTRISFNKKTGAMDVAVLDGVGEQCRRGIGQKIAEEAAKALGLTADVVKETPRPEMVMTETQTDELKGETLD